jgi:AraC-like DNA-binding protein
MFTDIEAFQAELLAGGLAPVLSRGHGAGPFRARVVTGALGPLKVIDLVTPEGECFRDGRSVRSQDAQVWQVELVTRGRARVEQGRSAADLGPGDLCLVDPAQPVYFSSTACRHVSMLVPRRELRLRPSDAASLLGVRIDGGHGPGALVSSVAREMARSLTGFRAGEADRSAAAVIALISVALQAKVGEVRPGPDEELRERILGYIEARLSDRDLAPAGIAAAHHVSVRRLHKLFEDQPLTVAAHIRQRRLERCRAELARSGRPVAAVAARWGFADPAHFSRLFKTTYGYNAAALTSNNSARMVNVFPARLGEDGGAGNTER